MCSLAFDGFYRDKKTRQVPLLNDTNSHQNDALIKLQLLKESNSPWIKPAGDTDFYNSAMSSEKFGSIKETITTTKKVQTNDESQTQQSLNTKENTEERTPRLITKQWVTQEMIWKVDKDTPNIKKDEALLHEHSAANYQSDAQAKHEIEDICSREEISAPDLEDYRGHGSEWDPTQENTLNCDLRADRENESNEVKGNVCSREEISTSNLQDHEINESEWDPRQGNNLNCNLGADTENNESREVKGPEVCRLSNLNDVSCDSARENVKGFKQPNKSGAYDEKSHAGTLIVSCAATGTPVRHFPVPATLQMGEIQASEIPSPELLDIAPTDIATTSDSANITGQVQEDTYYYTAQTDSLLGHVKEAEVTMTVTADADSHQSYDTIAVRKAKGPSSGQFNAPHYLGMQTKNQGRVKTTSSQPKRTEQVKHSRLRFARASRRSVLRNNTMPLL